VASALLALVGIAAAGFFVLVLLNAATTTETTRPGSGRIVTDETDVNHSPARAENPGATPVDPGDPAAVIRRNTLYQQGGLENGNCPAKPLGDASRQRQTVFYTALLDCLNDEWRPEVEAAGYAYQEPGLVVFDTPVDTPCGNASPQDGRTLAFYCPGDSVMYADVPQMRRFFDNIDVAYAIVIGHEFGHHVQEEVGILQAYDDLTYDDFDNRLELNRRVELQASCMGGLFLGAVADSFPMDDQRLRRLQQVAGSFGDEPGGVDDERDHGSGISNREWIFRGYTDNDGRVCNTFSASPNQVD
jgi:predicted metalloprotease